MYVGLDDAGGGFSESISEMCEELVSGAVPLLIRTPNHFDEAGDNRDVFLLDPSADTPYHLEVSVTLTSSSVLSVFAVCSCLNSSDDSLALRSEHGGELEHHVP